MQEALRQCQAVATTKSERIKKDEEKKEIPLIPGKVAIQEQIARNNSKKSNSQVCHLESHHCVLCVRWYSVIESVIFYLEA